jgi:surfactin synthase thioesterase subunit
VASLSAEIELLAVQLPDRKNRLAEPPEIDVPAVADAVDRPFARFGHSLGAWIAAAVAAVAAIARA